MQVLHNIDRDMGGLRLRHINYPFTSAYDKKNWDGGPYVSINLRCTKGKKPVAIDRVGIARDGRKKCFVNMFNEEQKNPPEWCT